MSHPKLPLVVKKVEGAAEQAIARLGTFLRIPAISCDPAHAGDVRRLAEVVRDDLIKSGFARA